MEKRCFTVSNFHKLLHPQGSKVTIFIGPHKDGNQSPGNNFEVTVVSQSLPEKEPYFLFVKILLAVRGERFRMSKLLQVEINGNGLNTI